MLNIFFKIDNTPVTLDPDPDQNWAKILDPDTNSMCLDPQHSLNTAFLKKKKISQPIGRICQITVSRISKIKSDPNGSARPLLPSLLCYIRRGVVIVILRLI